MFVIGIIIYFIIINILTFIAFAADKMKALKDGWRVKESTLLLLSFLGGAAGGILGMIMCRHKIRSLKFKILLPVFLILQIIIVGTIIYIDDYYHAEEAAYVSIQQPADGVSVAELENGTWVFSSETPQAGIIFYPGGKVEAESYAPLMGAFAEEGFFTVLISMPGNLAVLDQAAADGIKAEFPEIDRWYMAGHSLGGVMAASYLGDNSGAYEGLILLASYTTADLTGTQLEVLSIYGDQDQVLDMEAYEQNRKNLPADFQEVIIEGGCHAYFGTYGMQEGDGKPTITQQEQIRQTADAVAGFIGSE